MLQYHGITLEIDSVQRFSREAVYHFNRYLYTRFVLVCRVVYNPQATSYLDPAAYGGKNVAGPPPAVKGLAPALTDQEVRHFLLTPRRQLSWTHEGITPLNSTEEMLVSPARKQQAPNEFYTLDANNGPVPLYCNLVKRHANKTLEFDYAIQTDLNECHRYDSDNPAVLSHFWRMGVKVDQDQFATRHVTGEVVFRTDRLAELHADPDDFRRDFFHPVPAGFQRIDIQVEPSEDGTRCSYSFVDVQRPFTILGWRQNHVTRIEAYHEAASFAPSVENAAIAILGQRIGSEKRGLDIMPIVKNAPTKNDSLVVRVWGNREATRRGLALVAQKVLDAILPDQLIDGRASGSNDFSITEDLMGKFVELKASVVRGPGGTTDSFAGGVADLDKIMLMWRYVRDKDEIDDVTTGALGENPIGTIDSGTRGTFTGALVSASLRGACDVLAAPTDPGRYDSTTFQ